MTQAERVINYLRPYGKAGRTYWQITRLKGVGNSFWRRLSDDEKPQRYLREGEKLIHKPGPDGYVRWAVVRG